MGRGVASRYRAGDGHTGEFGATIAVPTEQLLFDLIVDERLDFALDARMVTLLGLFADPTANAIPDTALPLELSQPVMPLSGHPPVVAISGVPHYGDLVKFVYARMGWDAKNFRGCRLDLSYPPLGSTVLLRFDLPERAPT